MIWTAVKSYKIKSNLSIKSAFVEESEYIKGVLQSQIHNFEEIIYFISKFVESNDKIFEFNEIIRSISWDNIYGSNYIIFGNPLINSLDILQALIGQHIFYESSLTRNIPIIKCNFNSTNSEYFLLKTDNKIIEDNDNELNNNKYDICELNNLSKFISKMGWSSNENISIELYLDNEIHPIIKDEMIIIYHNSNNEELLKEYENHNGVFVILNCISDNDNNNINYNQNIKECNIQTDISSISNARIKKDVQSKLVIEFGDMNFSNFNFIFYKILSNLKYCKIVNEIILSVQQFISDLDNIKNIIGTVKGISDYQFQELNDNIKQHIKSMKTKKTEDILNTVNAEIIKFVIKMFMENMKISDEKLFSDILDRGFFVELEIKENDLTPYSSKWYKPHKSSPSNDFANYYSAEITSLMERINRIYIDKAAEMLSNIKIYKEMLQGIIDQLKMKFCNSNIFVLYQFSSNSYSTIELKSLGKNYASNYVIFGNPLIKNLDILKALINQSISDEENVTGKISIIRCNINPTNQENFVLQNDNKTINKKFDICELNNLSELISNLGLSANENISIELHLDNEIHPIIKDGVKIIYFNDFDINNEELFKEFEDYDEIAVILDNDNDNDKNRDIIKYFQSKHYYVQIYIVISHLETISNDRFKEKIQERLETGIKDVIPVSEFHLLFYKILSNLQYRKIINNHILSLHISHLSKPTHIDESNIQEIFDEKFQQLYKKFELKMKSIENTKKENILSIVNQEIIKIIREIFMENINNETKFPDFTVKFICEEAKIKVSELLAIDEDNANNTINFISIWNSAREILNDLYRYKKSLNDNLQKMKNCEAIIVVLYQ